jgi:hypothetical protein
MAQIAREKILDSTGWVGVMAAARLAERSPGWIQRQAVVGKIRTKLDPGIPARYSISDIRALTAHEVAEVAR